MTTQPSDWAVARAFRDVCEADDLPVFSENLLREVLERARELDASGDAPRAAEAGEPDMALLVSMATCLNHGFGLLDPMRQQSMLRDMRKLWDEAQGRGYYRPDRAGWYMSMLNPIKADAQDAAIDAAMGAVGAGQPKLK